MCMCDMARGNECTQTDIHMDNNYRRDTSLRTYLILSSLSLLLLSFNKNVLYKCVLQEFHVTCEHTAQRQREGQCYAEQ